jgi:hypothetical protein
MSLDTTRLLTALIILAAILAYRYRPRLLYLVAAAAVGLTAVTARPQSWNLFHYWLNTKYLNEFGYDDYYSCAAHVAPHLFGDTARNLISYDVVPITDLPFCPLAYQTPERLAEFTADLEWLAANGDLWRHGMIRDKGLNVTPTWLAVAGPLANAAAPGSPLWWLVVNADALLLAFCAGLVGWAMGWQRAALLTIWLCTWPSASITGHWLQYDWLILMLLAAVAWHKRWYGTAGAAIALAAAMRIFPVALLAWPLLNWKQVNRRFWYGLAAAGLAAAIAGSLTPRGLAIWPEFISKMARHSSELISEPGNYGLTNQLDTILDSDGAIADFLVFADGEYLLPDSGRQPAWWLPAIGFGAAAAGLVAVGRRRRFRFGDWLLVVYPALNLSRYYYGGLAVNMVEANKRDTIFLLALNLAGLLSMYYIHPIFGYSLTQYLLMAYVVDMVIRWPSRKTKELNNVRIFG